MSNKLEHVNVVAFVGLAGSHVEDIVQELTQRGYPKVTNDDIMSQIHHLAAAGQHKIITDEINDLDLFKKMKHEFPGRLLVIGIVTKRDTRHKRLSNITTNEPDDWSKTQTDISTVIGMADDYIIDNKDETAVIEKVTKLLTEFNF